MFYKLGLRIWHDYNVYLYLEIPEMGIFCCHWQFNLLSYTCDDNDFGIFNLFTNHSIYAFHDYKYKN